MLELKNITQKFNVGTVDEATLFDHFNFTVEDGDFVSVVGSNGSGKTTSLNLICGSLPLTDGEILFHGENIAGMPEHKRARTIGRVFQDPKAGTCGELTVIENMALADHKNKAFGLQPGVNRQRIAYYRSLLEQCEMGLEKRLNTKVGNLSGGQRQALALLIANMSKVDLLILDEHTAALDPKSSETIMQFTDKVVRENRITTLMVTHNLRFALEYGNRLVMLHEGKVVLDVRDEEKKNTKMEDILHIFNEISIECGN